MVYIGDFFLFLILIVQSTWAGTWFKWGEWNECSLLCDGGVSFRQRFCYGGSCHGKSLEYRLCNTQACQSTDILPENKACQAYGNQFMSKDYRWVPRQTYQCSVFCAEETRQIPDLVSVNLPNGIKCSKHSNHYCIGGKCVELGCDGALGSSKKIDDCGVCGGDSTSCKKSSASGKKHVYQWNLQWSFCSVSCGTGFQTARISCRNVKYSQTVQDFYCDYNNKPQASTRECSSSPCQPNWRMSSWESCSVQCGGGVQKRKVKCVHMTGRSKTTELPDYRCPDPIPYSERPCNTQFCPSIWQTGVWGQCSVTCGVGSQIRPVYCMKSIIRGIHVNVSDTECMGPKPNPLRPCSQPPCVKMIAFAPHIKLDNSTFIQLKKSKTIRLKVGAKAVLLPRQSVKIECPVQHFDKSLIFWTKNSRFISTSIFKRVFVTSRGSLKIKRTNPSEDKGVYTCIAGMENGSIDLEFQSKRSARQKAKKIKETMYETNNKLILNLPQSDVIPGSEPQNIEALPSGDKHSTQTVYMTSDWSKCSRTCGVGFQTRKVTCNIVSDKYIKIVSDNQCQDKVPENYRVCKNNPYCPVWKTGNWSECTTMNCRYDGVAEQIRTVQCVAQHNNTLQLPPKKCNQDIRPESKRQCHNDQCVAIWKTSRWTSCKPKCNKVGKKMRMLSCVWKHNKEPARDNCKSQPKPEVRRKCKPKHCKRECIDTSRYCSITKLLRMCRYSTFKIKCCATCTNSVLT